MSNGVDPPTSDSPYVQFVDQDQNSARDSVRDSALQSDQTCEADCAEPTFNWLHVTLLVTAECVTRNLACKSTTACHPLRAGHSDDATTSTTSLITIPTIIHHSQARCGRADIAYTAWSKVINNIKGGLPVQTYSQAPYTWANLHAHARRIHIFAFTLTLPINPQGAHSLPVG